MFSWWSLLYIHIFYSTQLFCDRTAKAKIRLHGCSVWSGPPVSAYLPPKVNVHMMRFICHCYGSTNYFFFLIFNKIFISNPLFTCVESVAVLKPLKFIKTKNNKQKWLAIHIWKRITFHTDKKSDYQNMVIGELLHFQGKQQCQNWFFSLLKTD